MSVEEWERGSRELVTSSSVDTFQPSSCTWSQSKPLPQGISNPAVAVLKVMDYLRIFILNEGRMVGPYIYKICAKGRRLLDSSFYFKYSDDPGTQ